jgi:CRISPR system Cascade subunit CasD
MANTYLLLYLDGPMQAWGHASRFNRRTTLPYPTRSGVTGMLCAALGIDRADRDALARFAGLEMEIVALSRGVVVRGPGAKSTGRPSRWSDYHTVGGGYDLKTHRQFMARKANEAAPDTVVTYREYLADARFGVLIAGEAWLLESCERALRDPVWGIWLGRKCCVPASLVCQGIFADRDAAINRLKELSGGRLIRRVAEVRRFDDGTDTLMDVPVSFVDREFRPRRVLNEPLSED